MSKNLNDKHPLIKQSEKFLSVEYVDRYGCYNLKPIEAVSLRVTPASLDRAIKIMDLALRAIEKRGYKIEIIKEYNQCKTCVCINGEKVSFTLEERTKAIPHVPTTRELEVKQKWGTAIWRKYDYIPTNIFVLEVYAMGLPRKGLVHKWVDREKFPLERQIDGFIRGLEEVGRLRAIETQNAYDRALDFDKRQADINQLKELRNAELDKVKILECQVDNYFKSKRIREYIDACKKKDLNPLQANLIKWAVEYADHLDPTKDYSIEVLSLAY